MVIEFKLPELGEGVESADIVGIHVEEGDTIEEKQTLFEIETDKAMVEVPAENSGKVTKIHVSEGDTVSVGDVLLTIETEGTKLNVPSAKTKTKTKTIRDALQIIDHMVGDDHRLRELIEEEGLAFEIAQVVYDTRTAARLTKTQFAKRVGVGVNIINDLEDADYEGHALTMLRRIAKALGKRVELRLVDEDAPVEPTA